jgi:hypothetical protein
VASAPAEQEGSVQWSAPNPPPNPVPTRVVPATRVILQPLGQTSKYNRTQMAQLNRWRGLVIRFTVEHPDEVYLNGQSEDKIVTLTFDDGPNSRYTPKILDIMKTYEAPGTFFFIGQDVKAMPKLDTLVWAQEEPKNNGAWFFVEELLEQCLADTGFKGMRPLYAGRDASASPATGLAKRHAAEQANLIAAALGHSSPAEAQPSARRA